LFLELPCESLGFFSSFFSGFLVDNLFLCQWLSIGIIAVLTATAVDAVTKLGITACIAIVADAISTVSHVATVPTISTHATICAVCAVSISSTAVWSAAVHTAASCSASLNAFSVEVELAVLVLWLEKVVDCAKVLIHTSRLLTLLASAIAPKISTGAGALGH